MDPETRQHIDKQEIAELAFRYCRAVDRRDWDALAPLFSDDSLYELAGFFSGPGKEFAKAAPLAAPDMEMTFHQITNHLISVEGDYAEGEVYVLAYHAMKDEEGRDVELVARARYLDKYTRREDGWKFLHRKGVTDHYKMNPLDPTLRDKRVDAGPVGGDFREDPSREFFRLLA